MITIKVPTNIRRNIMATKKQTGKTNKTTNKTKSCGTKNCAGGNKAKE